MSNAVEFSDFKIICRICMLNKDDMISFSSPQIIYMIEECTSVQVIINEKLPQQICNNCHCQLKNAYDFKQQCVLSSEILYNTLLQEEKTDENLSDETKKDFMKTEFEFDNVKVYLKTEQNTENFIEKLSVKSDEISENEEELSFHDDNDIDDDSSENEKKKEISSRQKSLADILLTKYKIYDLTCNICKKELSTRTTLLRHMETHNKNRLLKYKCETCNKGFFAIENLKKHEIRHLGDAKYQCNKCPKKFYVLSALGAHFKNTHKAEPIHCHKCSIEFYHPLQLEQHTQQIHAQKEFICDICGKVFSLKYKLKDHQSAHSEERPYPCSLCNKKFKHNFALTAHVKLQHIDPERREMCFVCGKLIIPGRLTVHLESHDKTTIHKCHICNKIYRNKYALRGHIKERHTKDAIIKKYSCKICNKVLGSSGSLTNHMAIMHSDVKKHVCSICGKSYKLHSHVKVHIQTAHMDVRPHICSTCNKAFHTKTLLKNHMRTHTGERPFPCSVCGKAFGFKNVLNTHMKVHSK